MSVKKLEVVYVVASRYDDDGYPYRWYRGVVPSNSLACLRSLTADLGARQAIPGVDIGVSCYDDTVHRIPYKKIAKLARRKGTRVVVGLVGVQSGQFERASDIAMEFRKHGVPVMIGGFHVSGMLALFDEPSPELQELLDAGVTLVQGEAESPGALEGILRDAAEGKMKLIYRLPKGPDIAEAPLPDVDPEYLRRFAVQWGTIDTSRGCPFACSFCTIINVQGRKMRSRSGQCVLDSIRRNYDKGVKTYFFTDDNFSRSAIWREVFDGLREMREEGIEVTFMIQVDTKAYRIPGFVEGARDAGCRMVFVGMESVNPENLEAVGKAQNNVGDYRRMVDTWREAGVLVHVGYIVGFPADTEESIRRDVAFLRDYVGVHEASFFMLTPLPGSEDHKNMVLRGDWLDPDLNKYDSFHETFQHPRLAPGRWKAATEEAYADFYSKENIVRILERTPADKYWYMFWNCIWYRYSGALTHSHPMSTGAIRRKDRRSRRPELPREGIFRFAWRRLRDGWRELKTVAQLFWEFQEIWLLTRRCDGEQRAPVRDLRDRWGYLQQRLAECNWSGHCDDIVADIRSVLAATADRLRELSANSHRIGRRQVELLHSTLVEIEAFLSSLDRWRPDRASLARVNAFLTQQVISRYEEAAFRYVRLRRRFNRWRGETVQRVKQGKLLTWAVVRWPVVAMFELIMGLRFGIAAIRQEKCAT